MLQARLNKSNKFRRDAWVDVNLDHIEYNLKQIHNWVKTPLMPILKANAYGHGASIIAPVLEAYDFVSGFGLASIDEAVALRELGIKKSLMVLGLSPRWSFEAALNQNIEITIVDLDSAVELNEVAEHLKEIASIHIKIDTGMNRMGYKVYPETCDDFTKFIHKIESLKNLKIKSIFSHFADPQNEEFTKEQLDLFQKATAEMNYPRHIASSGAAYKYSDTRLDTVRCGIELYGLDNPELKPALGLYARINYLKNIKAAESVSYKRTWFAENDSQIATLPLGYADGIPRALSNKMQGYYQDQIIKQVGIVTMDQITFDVSKTNARVGDIVELLGEHIPVSDWSKALGTISYEVVTNLSLRLPKVYSRSER